MLFMVGLLPGGVELDGSRLFRDRIYKQHGVIHPVIREKSSSESRTSVDLLFAYIIDNKRFTFDERNELNNAINEINSYTNQQLSKTITINSKLKWPLIRVYYIHYDKVKSLNLKSIEKNETKIDSESVLFQLKENNFIAQLKTLRKMDIYVTGPGTGQMYQTFLSDGSVIINIGGVRQFIPDHTDKVYTSYLEQYITSGTPYIKGLYYPINERQNGIKKDQVVQLIRKAAKLILQGFSLPVNPRENLAIDGQLFTEMCQKDKTFCSLITTRLTELYSTCKDFWVEDFIHENYQWKMGGFIRNGQNISCHFNRTLLRQLRKKYKIKHISDH